MLTDADREPECWDCHDCTDRCRQRDRHEWGPHAQPDVDARTCVRCGQTATNAQIASGRYGADLGPCRPERAGTLRT